MRLLALLTLFLVLQSLSIQSQAQDVLFYHPVKLDATGTLQPWYNPDPAISYDHMLNLVWNFWDSLEQQNPSLPYYMYHQVFRAGVDDPRGIGGDQIQMAMASWQLLYAYTGNARVIENMRRMADYYLAHSLSSEDSQWPHLPYPYNTLVYSGEYDGDMIIGPGFLQPDKAGSFALELIHLHKIIVGDSSVKTTPTVYLNEAIKMARVLAKKMSVGDADNSPLPFKVNAKTGEIGNLLNGDGRTPTGPAGYTTNWSSTMELFLDLQQLDPSHANEYQKAFTTLLDWMKNYPLKTNKWGPFFEDVQSWSDTQINAVTFARFMMVHSEYFPLWKTQVPGIFNWVYQTLSVSEGDKYKVKVIAEQSIFKIPGESHMARQGATQLQYAALTGDMSLKQQSIEQLTWATYTVDFDGKNIFPHDGVWLTDGYGDYVRHYLRAMAAFPELAPAANHILSSTSVVQEADYNTDPNTNNNTQIYYRTYDDHGVEIVRMAQKPASVSLEGKALSELPVTDTSSTGFHWTSLAQGGYLTIQRTSGANVNISN